MSAAVTASAYVSLKDAVDIRMRVMPDNRVEVAFDRDVDLALTPGAFVKLVDAVKGVQAELVAALAAEESSVAREVGALSLD
ncbi:hypothetical protein [Actinosynnema sp. NPDC020468]|uniref:hypothetical protein n=1 Tax=Actinosynnema sp. NPDC020468 TaxID=3154488 RepID=UPI0033F4ED8C